MSFQIPGRADRVFVPDGYGEPGYKPFGDVVSMLRVFDKGPDVQLEVIVRGIRAGQLQVPNTDELELRRRLFGDVPIGGMEGVGEMIQELEDFAAVQNIEGIRLARRRLVAYIEQLRFAAVYPPQGRATAQGDGANA